jgi:hypothetical protein
VAVSVRLYTAVTGAASAPPKPGTVLFQTWYRLRYHV